MFLNSYSSVWLCDGFIESILFPAVDPAVSWKYLFWICNSKILLVLPYLKGKYFMYNPLV